MINIIIDRKIIKNICILEDDLTRILWFKNTFSEFNIHLFETSNEMIDYIKYNHNKIDFFLLDHDLGGKQMESIYAENTGSRVADEIYKLGIDTPTVIHTWNEPGAQYMKSKIKNSTAIPFGMFKIEIIN